MSGNCGKYKCCLLYEAEEYMDFMENLPDYYQKISYNNQIYTVMDINIFNMIITITNKKEKLEVHYDEFIKVYNGNNS
jgi:cell fate regulator YaaT (PSP1 superfamily)